MPKPNTDNRSTRVAVRLDEAERKMADTVAKAAGLTISDWFRVQVRHAFEELRQPRKVPPTASK
jgi:antitoxin component of RelBE/YafQ-DinJ toxin-antitoxin module